MYLIQLNNFGNIDDCPSNSGWKAIKEFRVLVEKYDIRYLLLVALSVDYLSPYSHYSDNERILKAKDEIFERSKKINFNDELIVAAIEKYRMLQFNANLEQERVLKNIQIRILNNINLANQNENEVDIEKFTGRLSKHNKVMDEFNKNFKKEEEIKKAVTKSGYELSRIEQDIINKKEKSKFVIHNTSYNPSNLNLEN